MKLIGFPSNQANGQLKSRSCPRTAAFCLVGSPGKKSGIGVLPQGWFSGRVVSRLLVKSFHAGSARWSTTIDSCWKKSLLSPKELVINSEFSRISPILIVLELGKGLGLVVTIGSVIANTSKRTVPIGKFLAFIC